MIRKTYAKEQITKRIDIRGVLMEQVTLDSFADVDIGVSKEREAYSIVEKALRETLSKDNLSPDSVFFREGDSQKSQFSSIYLFSENNLLCRICFRGKQNYISVPAQYKDLIPEEYEYRVLASDPGVCRITLNTTQDVEGLTDVLCDIVEAQTDAYPAEFGCCSRYEACSDACRCIHPDPNMAIRCIYRKNLKKGRIFYGKNKVERSIATQLKNACSMDSLTFFDVEYANSKNKSICQIGLVYEKVGESESSIYAESILVDPEDGFDDHCVKVHGITAVRVKDAPNFKAVWPKIEKYFTNAVVIGHNVAQADLDALVKALRRYNLDIPQIYYLCTLDIAKYYIPSFAVENYKQGTLCKHFGIDVGRAHDAGDDSRACAELLRAIIRNYDVNLTKHIKKYVPHDVQEFVQYIESPVVRKSISEFYGILRGFSIDNVISDEETRYITQWKAEHQEYAKQEDIAKILASIDRILEDGVVTVDEILSLQGIARAYLNLVSTSPVTLATQILDGILRGITIDGEITESECKSLRQWLYDNIYLSDHFPFDRTIEMVEKVLEDGVITSEESKQMTQLICDMLNPVETLKSHVNSVDGKHVCLSGNFAFGQKSDIEKYIVERGGIIDSSVKKTTDILMIGDCECQAYSNGTYGTKVKKAMEYNKKGCTIQIIKEADFFATIR